MTPEILVLLIILALALVLFAFEWVPADVTGLGVLAALILTRLIPADRAFAGFGSDTVIMILGLLILTAALLRTGVVELAGRLILRRAGTDPNRLLILVMVATAGLSALINNTSAAAFFLPIAIGVATRAGVSPGRLLMPLAFGAILTSSVTLVATSTNVVVSSLMVRAGMPPMGMFEPAPVGIPIAVVGLLYMYFVGRRLIPDRIAPRDGEQPLGLRAYLTEVLVQPGSGLIGRTLSEAGLGRDLDLTVVQVIRNKTEHIAPRGTTRLQANDVLLVQGRREHILRVKDAAGLDIKADVKLSDPQVQAADLRFAEAIVMPRSPLIGRTLKSYRFRERFGLQVLGVHRHDEIVRRKISQVRLRMGDVLLLQGRHPELAALEGGSGLRILGAVDDRRPNVRRAPAAVIIFVATLAMVALDLVSLPVAVLLGVVAAFVTRCITPEEAYREVEWKVIILIGSMLALGTAMEETGAAEFFAARIVALAGGAGPVWLLSGFFLLTVILTQPMSNQAAAIVVLPVAMQTAVQLDLQPRTFAMMIAVAASCSYVTPLEPACLMVYGPGSYRFFDFVKVGAPLTVLIYLIAILLVPVVWPL